MTRDAVVRPEPVSAKGRTPSMEVSFRRFAVRPRPSAHLIVPTIIVPRLARPRAVAGSTGVPPPSHIIELSNATSASAGVVSMGGVNG